MRRTYRGKRLQNWMPIPLRFWKIRYSQRFPNWKLTNSKPYRCCSEAAKRELPHAPICSCASPPDFSHSLPYVILCSFTLLYFCYSKRHSRFLLLLLYTKPLQISILFFLLKSFPDGPLQPVPSFPNPPFFKKISFRAFLHKLTFSLI